MVFSLIYMNTALQEPIEIWQHDRGDDVGHAYLLMTINYCFNLNTHVCCSAVLWRSIF
jgi:hypothetical protein